MSVEFGDDVIKRSSRLKDLICQERYCRYQFARLTLYPGNYFQSERSILEVIGILHIVRLPEVADEDDLRDAIAKLTEAGITDDDSANQWMNEVVERFGTWKLAALENPLLYLGNRVIG